MSIKSIFNFFVHADGASKTSNVLEKSLEALNSVEAGLGGRAYTFILKGEQDSVLLELAKHNGNLGEWLGKPGQGNAWFHSSNPKAKEHGTTSRKERGQFYRLVTADQTLVLVRLGKILAAADQGQALDKSAGDRPPEWMQYLMNDVLTNQSSDSRNKESLQTAYPWLSALRLHQMLESDERDGTLALDLIFGRKNLKYGSRVSELLELPDLGEYVRAHKDAVLALPSTLDVDGRVALACFLGSRTLAKTFSGLLIRLASDSS